MGTFYSPPLSYGSVKRLQYCSFLFCWSVMLFTVICLFGVPEPNFLYEYEDETSHRMVVNKIDPHAYEVPSQTSEPSLLDPEVIRGIEKKVPSLPLSFWSRHQDYRETECAQLPSILNLDYSNEFWQRQRTSNGTFELYGAYLDNRKTIPGGDQFVRILGMVDRKEPKESVQMHCQLWYDDLDASFVVPLEGYDYVWLNEWGYIDEEFHPYLFSCRLPEERRNTVPMAVSLVENKCDLATNCLRVIYNKPATPEGQKDFAVCVKGLDFAYYDPSVRLVEWIELLNILGADKIFFYNLQVNPNLKKVLKYYEAHDKVELEDTKLAGGKPNIPGLQHIFLNQRQYQKRQQELIPYNDCLYKNMYRYKYIALLDIDEVIMPKGNLSNWAELMKVVLPKAANVRPQGYQSYNLRNVYFLDSFLREWNKEIPRYMHMLQHVRRAQNYTKPNYFVKCFHDTGAVLTLHNHFPLACLGGMCNSYPIDTEDGHLQHYRGDCDEGLAKSCEEFREHQMEDTTIWKWKDELVQRSIQTLDRLGFFRQPLTAPAGA